jgi:hypothetical protein
MKNKAIIFSLLALFFSVAACKEGKAKIEASPQILDLGEIQNGKMKSGVFIIKNTGNADLLIKHIEGSCSCTKLSISRKKIKPNQTAKVRFSLHAINATGKVTHRILLRNNSQKEFYFLKIKATILTD